MTRSSIPPRTICDGVGHMSLQMLDRHYSNRAPKDLQTWEQAMPLNLRPIPKNWQGFLLECAIAAKWPELQNGVRPKNDPEYQALVEILKKRDIKRPELDLFD